MTFRFLAAPLFAALAVSVAAQDDRVVQTNGTVIQGVKVVSFDIRSLRYTKGGANESVASDLVAKVEPGKFRDVYARGLSDPDLMLTVAREQLADKNTLMAQLGFVGAAAQFFDNNEAGKAVGALDELQKGIPEAGVLPEVYRQRFEYYMGLGQKGARDAAATAKRYQADATTGAWPNGFAVEAEFFLALSDRKDPKDFQARLRAIGTKAAATNPVVANRANVQLAHSLRETKDVDGAMKIYEDLAHKEGVDASSRAGAWLGIGKVTFDKAPAGDKAAFQKALLAFLRARAEKEAWPALHAEALYHAILAADKWKGPEYTLVMARCRRDLLSDFASSEWAERAKAGR